MKRISYHKSTPNTLVSDPMLANGRLVTCTISLETNSFVIQEGDKELAKGRANSVIYAKAKAKKALAELGVVFEQELRKRIPSVREIKESLERVE